MNTLRDLFSRQTIPVQPLPAGIYHYQSPPSTAQPYRIHLRLEADGSGILILNASTILHLNQTAAEYAYYFIQGTPEVDVVQKTVDRYQGVRTDQVHSDYKNLIDRIESLVLMQDLDPVTFFDFERRTPYMTALSAPLRMDCALTYRTSTGTDSQVAPTDHVRHELSTEEWKSILQKAWNAGIPHVVFTGGEPTLRADLTDLIAHAESLGQVAGLLTDGLRLASTEYLHQILQSGLDHVMLVLQPDEEASWEAVRDVLVEDIFLTIHLTVTPQNHTIALDYLRELSEMGVQAISLSATSEELAQDLSAAREMIAELGMTLVWDLPVPYSYLHPVAVEIGQPLPEGAGKAWIYIEPDGDVLAFQGAAEVWGNFLNEEWGKILERQSP